MTIDMMSTLKLSVSYLDAHFIVWGNSHVLQTY